jgi:hypothetical protein
LALDLDTYAERAETFIGEIDREYYLHYAGHKEEFEIEEIYDRHASLFDREVVERLREGVAASPGGEALRRMRYLLELAVGGLMGRETKAEAAALAEREATLEIEVDGRREPYRQAAITQANEPDPERRAAIESARLDVLANELNPLHERVLDRTHEISRELGWETYRGMCAELKQVDLVALERQTRAFLAATESGYRPLLEPRLQEQLGFGFDRLRRSDLARFFRAVEYDALFPGARLMGSFEDTLKGLGIDPARQPNVRLDTEQRPQKSPRAFCAPVRVPDEVYLVIPRTGGRDDFGALFHEGGHTEHYANVDPDLPFEFRHLGDNSVTECFAFLMEHLTEDPHWLREVLGVEDPGTYLDHARATKLLFMRRYSAKLSYEMELHGGERERAELPGRYAALLGAAVGVEWPRATWLADVDEGFYAANYLRAWAFESYLRRTLVERFGTAWFSVPEAGAFLRSLWREGQRLSADELLAEVTGDQLDFGVMVADVLGHAHERTA